MADLRENKKPAAPGATKRLIDRILAYEHLNEDWCINWPYGTNSSGYGKANYPGFKTTRAHRIICELWHGPPPSPKHEAAHSCGRRICVNPLHLRWATPAQNCADKIEHGTNSRKLTESDVRAIRNLRGVQTQQKLGEMFGVDQATISEIQTGRIWSWFEKENIPAQSEAAVLVATREGSTGIEQRHWLLAGEMVAESERCQQAA